MFSKIQASVCLRKTGRLSSFAVTREKKPRSSSTIRTPMSASTAVIAARARRTASPETSPFFSGVLRVIQLTGRCRDIAIKKARIKGKQVQKAKRIKK